MKDFYDIHNLMTDNKDKVNTIILAWAIRNTFNSRSAELDTDKLKKD
jgi:hypothetical protein